MIRSIYLASGRLQQLARLAVAAAQWAWPGTALERRLLTALAKLPPRSFEPIAGRVLLVNTTLSAGGAERQIVATLIGLASRSEIESVALVTGAMAEPAQRFHLSTLEAAGIEVVRTPSIDHPLNEPVEELFSLLPGSLGPLARGWYRVFRERRPEVVHAWQDATSIAAGLAAFAAGVPRIVLAGRNLSPLHFIYWRPALRPGYRVLAGQPSVRLINNSLAGASDYAAWLGLDPSLFAVLRNGFAIEQIARPTPDQVADIRRRLGVPVDAPVIGSVLRYYPEKRPGLWLDMAAAIAARQPDAHFVLVGWGPLEAAIRRQTIRLRLGHRLHLVPATPDVAGLIAAMDVFVLTSRLEGTPNVLIEAQALGVPVVTTPAGGAEEAIEHGKTGLLSQTSEPGELADLAIRLLKDDAARSLAAARGPVWIAERFGMDRMIGETLALYGLAGRTR